MDIHPPDHPILSLREFFVHIGTVTIGILIALSLEGLLEWNHHQHVIREARDNIRSEIHDNAAELASHLSSTSNNRHDLQTILRWIADIERDHKSSVRSLTVNFNRAELSSTSWTTAQAVGAMGLMEYGEVKRDADIYHLQDEFVRLQTQAEDTAITAMILFTSNPEDPSKASASDLNDERMRVANSLSALFAQEQIGNTLEKRYRTWLAQK